MAERWPPRRTRLLPSQGRAGADGFTITDNPDLAIGEYALLALPATVRPTAANLAALLSDNRLLFQQALAHATSSSGAVVV